MLFAVIASALIGQAVPIWSLEDCLRLARENQPRFDAARAAVEGAEARSSQALAGLGPRANAAASVQRLTSPISGLTGTGASNDPFTLYNVGVAAAMPLWNGEQYYEWREASKREEAAQWLGQAAALDIDLTVAAAVFDYRLAVTLRDIYRSLQEKTGIVFESARALVQAGRQAPIDAVRAEALFESARADAVAAEAAVINADRKLLAALGLDPATPHALAAPATWETEFPYDATSYTALGMERIPALRALRLQREAAERAVTGSKWGHLPNLIGSGGYGLRANEPSGPWAPNWNVGLTLNVPLFTSGETYFRTAELRANLAQVAAQEALLVHEIRTTATRYFLEVSTAQQRLAARVRALRASEANVDFARGRYAAGAGSIIEVTDAELLLANAQIAAAVADHGFRLSRAGAFAAANLPLTPDSGK